MRTALFAALLAALLAAVLLPIAAHAQPAVVRGTVRDSAARPIGMAEVIVDDSLRARTDSAGRFALTNLPAGETELTVRRVGFAPLSIPLQLAVGRTRTLAIELAATPYQLRPVVVSTRRRGLFGTVVNAAGAPIDSAEVFVVGAGEVARTNEDGAFAISGLRASTYLVRVRREGHRAAQFSVALPPDAGREVRVRLDPLADDLQGGARRIASGFGTLDAVRLRDFDARMRINTPYVVSGDALARGGTRDIREVLLRGDLRPTDAAARGRAGDPSLAAAAAPIGMNAVDLPPELFDGGTCWFVEGTFSTDAPTIPAEWLESMEVMRRDPSQTLVRKLPSSVAETDCRLFVVVWYRR